MSSWEKKEEKTQHSVSNNNNTNNTNNTVSNTPSYNSNPLSAPVPPPMYYYQPFRPSVNPMMGYPPGATGYAGYMPVSMQGYAPQNGLSHNTQSYVPGYPTYAPVPYMQMGNSYNYSNSNFQVPQAQQIPSKTPQSQNNLQRPQLQKQQAAQNQKPPVKKPATVQNQKKPHNISSAPISSTITAYNLDDPEELEKWKAERRKKFPGVKKEVESNGESVSNANTSKESCESLSEEEGALSEDVDEEEEVKEVKDKYSAVNTLQKRKRICKYFLRGKCNKGDSCQFEHVAKNPKKAKTENLSGGRSTIFENLLKIEEKESMMKFYECIKLLVRK